MPIILFAIVMAALVVVYYFVINNESKFIREKPKANDPFKVIYLPDDLEAEKAKRKKTEHKTDHKNEHKKEGPEDEV